MLFATASFFTDTLGEELAKQLLGQHPILSVDAIFHFGRLYFTLNEPCIFQLLEVLGYSRLGDG